MLHILQVGNYMVEPGSGVAKKTHALVRAFRSQGQQVMVHAVVDENQSHFGEAHGDIHLYSCQRAERANAVRQLIQSHVGPGDAILFRYPWASAEMLEVVRAFGHQIVFEHNTDEEAEALLLQREHLERMPFRLSWSYLHYWFRTQILHRTVESTIGPRMLQAVSGGVCMTEELAERERGRYSNYITKAIANGCALGEHKSDFFLPINDSFRAVMLIGAPAPWHGLDRVFKGLQSFAHTNVVIRLDVIGVSDAGQMTFPAGVEVLFLGRLDDNAIEALLPEYHIGIGTLALHRKRMREACPLKVRQCMAAGLPMVLGYRDTDISPVGGLSPFVLQVAPDDAPLDWRSIIQFYEQLLASTHTRENMLREVKNVMSVESKAEAIAAFMKSLGLSF